MKISSDQLPPLASPPCCASEQNPRKQTAPKNEARSAVTGKFRLLDLFCCAGGAGEGYRRAGFDVTGVDIVAHKNNPHSFILADALEYAAAHGHEYDAIHASPPCQAYSMAAKTQRNAGKVYPDLLAKTRDALNKIGKPWVIENVPGSPMQAHFKLCGCLFDLKLRRERWFETSWGAFQLRQPCHHPFPVVSVVGHGTPTWVREKLGFNPTIKDYREAMGIDWMNRDELSQAIPPAYTAHIGAELMKQVAGRVGSAERRAGHRNQGGDIGHNGLLTNLQHKQESLK